MHEAAQASNWTPSAADEVERRAVSQLFDFDKQIAALAGGSRTSSSYVIAE
jgi:hypothetical protein